MQSIIPDDHIVIAKFGSVHGIKGWIKIQSFSHPLDSIYQYLPWQACLGKNIIELEVEAQADNSKLMVKLIGYNSPEESRKLTNALIIVKSDRLPVLDNDEYYWFQLQNLQVFTRDEELLGIVSMLLATGSNDVIEVSPCDGSIDNKKRLLPYIEQVVLKVDLVQKTIRVDWDKDF